MSNRKNRLTAFDVAKGIGIVSIILGHLGVAQIDRIVYTYHVPLFYILGGYFLRVGPSLGEFVKKKSKRLLVPYFLTCLAICILSPITDFLTHNPDWTEHLKTWAFASIYGAGSSWSEPFVIPQIGATWFLWAMFWGLTFAYFILLKPTGRLILIPVLVFLGQVSSKIVWLPFSIQAGCLAALYILLGYGLNRISYFDSEPKFGPVTLAAFVVWICAIVKYNAIWCVVGYFGNGVSEFFATFCACYCVLYLAKCVDRYSRYGKKLLIWWGQNSLTILCVHLIDLIYLHDRCYRFLLGLGLNNVPALVLLVILKLAFASGVTQIISWSKKTYAKGTVKEAQNET